MITGRTARSFHGLVLIQSQHIGDMTGCTSDASKVSDAGTLLIGSMKTSGDTGYEFSIQPKTVENRWSVRSSPQEDALARHHSTGIRSESQTCVTCLVPSPTLLVQVIATWCGAMKDGPAPPDGRLDPSWPVEQSFSKRPEFCRMLASGLALENFLKTEMALRW